MRKRSLAREFAVQVLYQLDIAPEDCQRALNAFWMSQETAPSQEVKTFTGELVAGTLARREEIDERLRSYSNNWRLERMAFVDRNILRLGCYELLFRGDIPPKVTINEAVDLAKKYSGPEAGKFVNGILDKINQEKSA